MVDLTIMLVVYYPLQRSGRITYTLSLLEVPQNPRFYNIFPTMDHFNLMPGDDVAGMASELDVSFHLFHPRGDPSYPATLSGCTFDEYFGNTQRRG